MGQPVRFVGASHWWSSQRWLRKRRQRRAIEVRFRTQHTLNFCDGAFGICKPERYNIQLRQWFFKGWSNVPQVISIEKNAIWQGVKDLLNILTEGPTLVRAGNPFRL